MHPKEFKHEKAGTGRLTHLSLSESEILMGVGFDEDKRFNELIDDPRYFHSILYPGPKAINLSNLSELPIIPSEKRLLVFLIDGTWSTAKKMMKLTTKLHQLPRFTFTANQKSIFDIKQQPHPDCLSTLEAVHFLLFELSRLNIDNYPDQDYFFNLLQNMQNYQKECAADPNRQGYRHRAFKKPEERKSIKTFKRKIIF